MKFKFIISPFTQFLKIIILCIGIIIIYINYREKMLLEVNLLILSLIWIFLILISVNSLILLILLMEIHGIIAFTLTGIKENSSLSKEAMIKFFILGVIAAAFMGFGISIIYFILGSVNINEICLLINDSSFIKLSLHFKFLIFIGTVFFVGGFFFKLAIVPFHFWIGDIYQGAPLGIVFFLQRFLYYVMFIYFQK